MFHQGQQQGGINPIFIIMTLVFLTFYSMISSFLQHNNLPIHKSAVAIITGKILFIIKGIIAGFVMFLYSDTNYQHITKLNDEIVYTILYPPMLFAAGFNLKKKAFVKNMSYISMFGILGTFVFFVLIVLLLLWANQLSKLLNLSNLDLVRDAKDINTIRELSVWEILLLGACFCSIDTIASEEAISSRKFPKLFSIVFGEGIFKDAVTIVLFRSILRLQALEEGSQFIFFWNTPFKILWNFIVLVVSSCFQGVVMAFLVTFVFKRARFLLHNEGITETCIVFLNGFCIYVISEAVSCSGVISVLIYGITLNHYGTYNMSKKGVEIAKSTFEFTSIICEGILFLIMGIVVWQGQWAKRDDTTINITHSYVFALCVAVILLVGRTINVLLVVGLGKLFSKKFTINRYEVFILIISGLVKGATPFALFSSVKLGGNSAYARNEGMVLKTTIIMIIIASSIFLNSLIPRIYKKSLEKLEIGVKEELLSIRTESKRKKRNPTLMARIEENYIKHFLIYDYEQRKDQIEKIKELNKKKSFAETLKELGEEENADYLLTESSFNGKQVEYAKNQQNDVSLLTIHNEETQNKK